MLKKTDSDSIIAGIRQETKSVAKSEIGFNQILKKSEILQFGSDKEFLSMKRLSKKKSRNQLKSISKSKQSIPYRLYIKKVFNLPTFSKKSSSSTSMFLHFSINMYVRKQRNGNTHQVEMLGDTFHYQCQESLFKGDQSRHSFPISFFYHSKVDKNSHSVYFAVSIKVNQIKSGFIQNSYNLGFFIVQNPFVESNQSGIYLCPEQIYQIQYPNYQNYEQMSKGSQGARVDYQITSFIQLKRLVKLIPQHTIFAANDRIAGLYSQFLSNDYEIDQILESNNVNIKVKYLQIHIPDSFQEALLSTVKSFPNSIFSKKDQIKGRKISIGFSNYNSILNSVQKRLEFVEKQNAGEYSILIYQCLKDGQTASFSYYLEEQTYPISVCLIYQIGDKQFEVAQLVALPVVNNQSHEISQQMNTLHMINPLKSQYLVKTSCTRKPTLIMEYISEEIMDNAQSLISGYALQQGKKSSQSFLKSSHKFIQDKLKDKERLLQQIQYQKLSLEKQKELIQKIKTQNYIQYQEQFQKRFQLEKQNLMKRQQMLELQYREQVQRQIRQKYELEETVKQMKQKIRAIQGQRQVKKRMTDDEGIESFKRTSHEWNQNLSFQGSIMNNLQPAFNQNTQEQIIYNRQMPTNGPIQQKIDPAYLVEPQNAIPIAKVRQMMRKNQTGKKDSNYEISKVQFNRGSKFTFTFSSISWFGQEVNHPNQIFFVIRFFNFPEYKTDKITYIPSQTVNGYCQLLRAQQYNRNIQDVHPIYTFTVDPSQYRNPKILQQDLTDYLFQNSCIVDIFDGQTHVYLGQINIKLNQLIRGTKVQTFIAKQYHLIKIKTRQNLGLIQIVIKNQEIMCQQSLQFKANSAIKEQKSKVISYTPMTIPKTEAPLKAQEKINQHRKEASSSNRLEQRISKFKQRQKQKKISDNADNFIILPEQDKKHILTKINNFKQKNMKQYIKTVYSSLLHENITINAQFGKAQTFTYTFINQSTSPSSYKIVIDSIDENVGEMEMAVGNHEQKPSDLQVIKQASEWRYYVKTKNYTPPKFYQIINQSNVFYLNAGQSLSIVFKYLTFAHFSKIHQDININVSIIKIDSNWIAGGFSLNVQLHQQIVHHSYILYEPGNQVVDLILPVIYTNIQQYGPGSIKKLYLTDEDQYTEAQWLNQFQILLRISTPNIMRRKTFNLLLYDDQYFDQLKENWLITVNSYEGVWTQCRHDSNTKFKIALPMGIIPTNLGLNFYSSSLNNMLILNSSDPSLQFDNNKILAQFGKIREGGAYQIWCQLLSSQNLKKQIQITCTSQENSTLIYGWIVQVFPYSVKRN